MLKLIILNFVHGPSLLKSLHFRKFSQLQVNMIQESVYFTGTFSTSIYSETKDYVEQSGFLLHPVCLKTNTEPVSEM
jgi:hypothetical protein